MEKSALTVILNLSTTRIALYEIGSSACFAFGWFAAAAASGVFWFAGLLIALRSGSIV
ncbi:MAG TPA: hypothetical protein VHW70_05815 [Edaphobacter sp.]|jgi:hypothetical protein|nr:hypothetical protein [Edaphobacter sp.]